MIVDDLKKLEAGYRMPPAMVYPPLEQSGVTLLRWRRRENDPSHVIQYALSSYTLSLVLQPIQAERWFGTRKTWSGTINANSMRIRPPGVDLRWKSGGAFDFLLFVFPEETIDRIAGNRAFEVKSNLHASADILRTSPSNYVRDDVAASIGRQMIAALISPQMFDAHFTNGLSYGLIARLLGRFTETSAPARDALRPSALRRVCDYVSARLDRDITVAELAEIAGLSESYFAHAFRETAGLSPYRYITATRIHIAQQLLVQTSDSILNISLDCGFKDPSHFARVFRAATGLTPNQYRRQ